MLRTVNDMVGGQSHSIRVERLGDGRFKASETVLGDGTIAPVIAADGITATQLLSDKLAVYDATGEPQK